MSRLCSDIATHRLINCELNGGVVPLPVLVDDLQVAAALGYVLVRQLLSYLGVFRFDCEKEVRRSGGWRGLRMRDEGMSLSCMDRIQTNLQQTRLR